MTAVCTHLSFVPMWNGVQLRKLCTALRELPEPRVLLGDLNMPPPFPLRPRAPSAATTAQTGAAAAVLLSTALGTPVSSTHAIAGAIENGPFPETRSVESPALAVSDHRALLVEL